mmetsp:Transcript_158044/g.294839  ORF Transcript_158044/g.294839 Transcript_158044/m.294839 type:complete len:216 (+) Transcript_158044:1503-2150(+)
MRVSLESRYGTWRVASGSDASAKTTLPNAVRDELMATASWKRAPSALDLASRSEPAKSTKLSETLSAAPSTSVSTFESPCLGKYTLKTVCDLEDWMLAAVLAVARRAKPRSMIRRTSARSFAGKRVSPLTWTRPPGASRIFRFSLTPCRRPAAVCLRTALIAACVSVGAGTCCNDARVEVLEALPREPLAAPPAAAASASSDSSSSSGTAAASPS